MPSIFHLVAGPIGAGKTTYAIELASRYRAVRFSIDEWMVRLFGPDLSGKPDPIWSFERVSRCHEQIMSTSLSVAGAGVDVVLDLGFTTAMQRSVFVERIRSDGHDPRLHWLDVPSATRWSRVQERNLRQDATFAFPISREMFDFMEDRCETPSEAERSELASKVLCC